MVILPSLKSRTIRNVIVTEASFNIIPESTTDGLQQCRLSTPRWPHQGKDLPRPDAAGNPFQYLLGLPFPAGHRRRYSWHHCSHRVLGPNQHLVLDILKLHRVDNQIISQLIIKNFYDIEPKNMIYNWELGEHNMCLEIYRKGTISENIGSRLSFFNVEVGVLGSCMACMGYDLYVVSKPSASC